MDTSSETEAESPLVLTGRVCVARQMLTLCGDADAPAACDLGPCEDADPQPGDLKLSSRLDAKGKLAFQDGQNQCFISGVLCASIYDGTSWRKFDLRSITPRASYPNPTLLASVIAWVRSAAELAAGQPCVRTGAGDTERSTEDRIVAVAGTRQAT